MRAVTAADRFRLSSASSLFLHLIRGGAAQAVLVGHASGIFDLKSVPYLQNSAVVLFFILSGFVIPYSSLTRAQDKADYSFASYFVDRFSRIYMGFVPALFFVLVIECVGRYVFGLHYPERLTETLYAPGTYVTIPYSRSFDVRTFVGNLLMLQDYPFQPEISHFLTKRLDLSLSWLLPITSFGSARPFWTVAIEWWIYLLFGWIAFGSSYKTRHPLGFWLIAMLLLIVPSHNWIWAGRGNGLAMTWGMGLLVYIVLSRLAPPWPTRFVAIAGGMLATMAVSRLYLTREAYDPLYAGLLASAVYCGLAVLQRRKEYTLNRLDAAIKFNADISYMLYLVHYTVLDFVFRWRGVGIRGALLGIGLSNAIAIGLYIACDRHHRALGGRLKRALAIP